MRKFMICLCNVNSANWWKNKACVSKNRYWFPFRLMISCYSWGGGGCVGTFMVLVTLTTYIAPDWPLLVLVFRGGELGGGRQVGGAGPPTFGRPQQLWCVCIRSLWHHYSPWVLNSHASSPFFSLLLHYYWERKAGQISAPHFFVAISTPGVSIKATQNIESTIMSAPPYNAWVYVTSLRPSRLV